MESEPEKKGNYIFNGTRGLRGKYGFDIIRDIMRFQESEQKITLRSQGGASEKSMGGVTYEEIRMECTVKRIVYKYLQSRNII